MPAVADFFNEGEPVASITTQTTTTVKSGSGVLRRVIIPTPTASATVKIYDNTAASGALLMDTMTLPGTLLSDGPLVIEFGGHFGTGLTVVTGGATMSVSVVYR